MTPLATSIFCIATLVALVGFDVFLALDGVDGNTYSERIRALGKLPILGSFARVVIAFSLGGLCVHFWGW